MSVPGAVPVGREELEALVASGLTGLEVPEADARVVAEVLVDANLRGVDTHGIVRAPIYMRRVALGLTGGTGRVRVVREDGPSLRLDAAQALGPAAGVLGLDRAVALAGEHGVAVVAVGGSTHFGHAGFYARRAAERELVALVWTNAPMTMAPFGAGARFLGTNPLAVGLPLGRHGAFVLDMATSVAARGRIIRARDAGREIEPGLALDADGRPTTDAEAALAGTMLPLGGPKGSGLALAIALLAGLLAGADFDDELADLYGEWERTQKVGHVFVVLDPWRLGDRAAGLERAAGLIDRLHALPPAAGHDGARFPGEPEAALAAERERDGVPVDPRELEAFATTAAELGLDGVAARARALAR